ncbi:MAG: LysR substrate-binding domain-containing protein [Gammaproteobacteria bacterium]|nr:LysR substrate-binding domain-containing protein [Gammaproteobacteria bacterium]MDH4315089.1 LysR substrate-binding domain-containing protein [Gammaproteobacteria bacterium]MDH5214511.1 LysR substrate-binding domain-containing protein [Gammaproteobacteria bacterium]
MKLQQLKYLLAIADNGLNITAAAERLYTSQPGVSKQLKLLEEELGLQLFTRKGKSLDRVTDAGTRVIDRARIIMQEVEQIRSFATEFYREEEGTLSIGTTHTQARYVLPKIVQEFRRRYPRVSLCLHQGTSEQVACMVADNEVDIAIATGNSELFNGLLMVPGYQWDRKILVPKNHELTKLDRKVSLADIARYPLVSYVFSFGGDSALHRAFASLGLKPEIVFTARDADVIKTYVRMGMGIGIVAGMAHENEDNRDLAAIDATGLFPRSTTWIGFRRNQTLRLYMMDFIQLFAPHIDHAQLQNIAQAENQQQIDSLLRHVKLPLRNGGSNGLCAAA